jgi:hypothetical protein
MNVIAFSDKHVHWTGSASAGVALATGERVIPDACGQGHPLTPDNLHIDAGEGRWRCRRCGAERVARYRSRAT